jgi:hypothetical protein
LTCGSCLPSHAKVVVLGNVEVALLGKQPVLVELFEVHLAGISRADGHGRGDLAQVADTYAITEGIVVAVIGKVAGLLEVEISKPLQAFRLEALIAQQRGNADGMVRIATL